jgi:hypothetical protein
MGRGEEGKCHTTAHTRPAMGARGRGAHQARAAGPAARLGSHEIGLVEGAHVVVRRLGNDASEDPVEDLGTVVADVDDPAGEVGLVLDEQGDGAGEGRVNVEEGLVLGVVVCAVAPHKDGDEVVGLHKCSLEGAEATDRARTNLASVGAGDALQEEEVGGEGGARGEHDATDGRSVGERVAEGVAQRAVEEDEDAVLGGLETLRHLVQFAHEDGRVLHSRTLRGTRLGGQGTKRVGGAGDIDVDEITADEAGGGEGGVSGADRGADDGVPLLQLGEPGVGARLAGSANKAGLGAGGGGAELGELRLGERLEGGGVAVAVGRVANHVDALGRCQGGAPEISLDGVVDRVVALTALGDGGRKEHVLSGFTEGDTGGLADVIGTAHHLIELKLKGSLHEHDVAGLADGSASTRTTRGDSVGGRLGGSGDLGSRGRGRE